jgi:hypothetical protein
LTALGGVDLGRGCGWGSRTGSWRCAFIHNFQFGYRAQKHTPMAKRSNADFFEILITQIRQDDKTNVILGESLSVLREAKLTQPVRDLLHWRPLRI